MFLKWCWQMQLIVWFITSKSVCPVTGTRWRMELQLRCNDPNHSKHVLCEGLKVFDCIWSFRHYLDQCTDTIFFFNSSIRSYCVGRYQRKRGLIQQHTCFRILKCRIRSLNKREFWELFSLQTLVFQPFRTFSLLFVSEHVTKSKQRVDGLKDRCNIIIYLKNKVKTLK